MLSEGGAIGPIAGTRYSSEALRRARGFCAILLVPLILLGMGTWVQRQCILQRLADIWVVSDPVEQADVAVVLGGGVDTRPLAAADFYRRGLVKRIIISDVPNDPAGGLGSEPDHVALNRNSLLKLGIPKNAIGTFGDKNSSSYREAVALKKWAVTNGVSSVVIPTEIFSSRRTRWIFRHELEGTDVKVAVTTSEPRSYSQQGWWRTESGIMALQREVIKYVYYRLRY
jgi:uncharacterized SAM-binding protein YcdF (DUF218 family)